jgi:hypothetical protein
MYESSLVRHYYKEVAQPIQGVHVTSISPPSSALLHEVTNQGQRLQPWWSNG